MAASMTRLTKKAAAGRAAAPVRAARLSVRAQAMDNTTPKQFRTESAVAATAALPSSTPFDNWKFAPIREATVSDTTLGCSTRHSCIRETEWFVAAASLQLLTSGLGRLCCRSPAP